MVILSFFMLFKCLHPGLFEKQKTNTVTFIFLLNSAQQKIQYETIQKNSFKAQRRGPDGK